MRIRSIKPEYFTHPEIVALSIPARLLFLSLLGQADDEGRLYDQATKIRGEAFGEDDRVKVAELLAELAREGRIRRYVIGKRRCIQIMNFSRHQRVSHPTRSRIPPEVSEYAEVGLPETFVPDLGSREQGAGNGAGSKEQGTREQGSQDQELPPAAGEEGWNAPPNGWTNDQFSLWRKLFSRDPNWSALTPAALNRLNKTYGKGVATNAMRDAWEETALGSLADDPYPFLESVCKRLVSA